MTWYEARLRPDCHVSDFYRQVPESRPYQRLHHFWDEPWWPKGYVVRMETDDPTWLEHLPSVAEFSVWDSSEDEHAYGEAWDNVSMFFHVSSTISNQDPRMAAKLVHCFLNARGMTVWDEAKFHARLLWGRLTVELRWKLYMRRRWERQQQLRAAA